MSEQEEKAFADLVRRAGPAPRDPMFRFKVLERRETHQFRRRSWMFVAVGLIALAGAALMIAVRPGSIDVAAVIVFGIGLSAAGFFFAPALLRRLSALRR